MTHRRCPICHAPHHRLGRTKPLAALKRAPARLAALIRRVPRPLLARRPGRASWAINEVMCHLADAEVALAFRLRKIASEPGAVIPGWDQERWADGGHYRRTPAAEALRAYARLREANLDYVARLRPAQLDQYGRHPEYGRMSIRQVLDHWAEHDLNHLEQMRAALSSLTGRA